MIFTTNGPTTASEVATSSAYQFQNAQKDGKPLYQAVMEEMMEISTPDNMMFVVGATKADKLQELRSFCPDNFFLVPGVGAQGGSAEEVIANGSNEYGGLLINSSRGIPTCLQSFGEVALGTSGDGHRFVPGAFCDSLGDVREMAYHLHARRR